MDMKRILTGAALIPVLYLVVWHLPPAYFILLIMAAAAVGMHEFYRLAQHRGAKPLVVPGISIGVLLVFNFAQPLLPDLGIGFFLTASIFLVLIGRLFSPRPVEGAGADIAMTVLGIFYVALLFGYQAAIRMVDDGKLWIVFLYLVIWASDTAAYYIGSAFGKHRLYEKISPKKSLEGLAAGLIAAPGAAVLCRAWFLPEAGLLEAALLGLTLAAVGVVGDLVESLFKRSAGVKDSGALIPGHGGVLDRMDSVLFAAPVLFYYLMLR